MEEILKFLNEKLNRFVFKEYTQTLNFYTNTFDNGEISLSLCPKVALSNYIYIHDVKIEDYGIVTDNSCDAKPQNEINGAKVDIHFDIINNLICCCSHVEFKGYYKGNYADAIVLDSHPFIANVKISGISKQNCIFEKNRNPLGKLLECIDDLYSNKTLSAFDNGYIALEMLIKQINNFSSLKPIETKKYLKKLGFNDNELEQIRILRNNHKVHPNKFGYADQNPNLSEKLMESLKYIIYMFFYLFENIVMKKKIVIKI